MRVYCSYALNLFKGGRVIKKQPSLFSVCLAVLLFSSVVFSSCTDFFNGSKQPGNGIQNPQNKYITVKGSVSLSSIRSAFPELPQTGIEYYAKATSDHIEKDGTTDGTSYTIPLLDFDKEWVVEVGVTDGTNVLLSDSFTLTSNNYSAEEACFVRDVVLKADAENGTGTINLKVNVNSDVIADYGLNYVEAVSEVAGACLECVAGTEQNGKIPFTIRTTGAAGISSGANKLTINFYKKTSETSLYLLYSITDVVSVFKNMQTETWLEGVPLVTKKAVADFIVTQIYVGECIEGVSPSDSSKGTMFKPFATVDHAFNYINNLPELNSSGKEITYTIHVKNGITETVYNPIVINRNVVIESWKTSPGDKQGTFTLTWQGEGASMIQVSKYLTLDGVKTKSNPLTYSGVTLYGGKGLGVTGRAFCVFGGLKINGATINNFDSGDGSGSAIYYENRDEQHVGLTITGASITGNKTSGDGTIYVETPLGSPRNVDKAFVMENGDIYANSASGSGGGVYVKYGLFVMKDGLIRNNNANGSLSCGGGVCVDSDAVFKMEGGTIKGNTSSRSGGGIYNKGISYIYGTSVIGDRTKTEAAKDEESKFSNRSDEGGGIKTEGTNAKLYLGFKEDESGSPVADNAFNTGTGGVYYNYAAGTTGAGGGGICFTSGLLWINGGNIAYNSSANKGGAISSNDNSIVLAGNPKIPVGNEITNDIWLNETGKFILKSGFGTGSTGIVGTINRINWSEGVLIAQSEDGSDLDDSCLIKFDFVHRYRLAFAQNADLTDDKTQIVLKNSPEIYIAGTLPGNNTYALCAREGDDANGIGTRTSPFATLQGALTVMDSFDIDYVVYVDGRLTGQQTLSSDLATSGATAVYKAKSLLIKGASNKTMTRSDISSGKDVFDAGIGETAIDEGTAFKIETDVPVTFEHILITGGNTTEGGGGISIAYGATVTLGEGSCVAGNNAVKRGGGVDNSGTLIINDEGRITYNTVTGGTFCNCYGGGVYSTGKVVMQGGYICQNTVKAIGAVGGGICLYSSPAAIFEASAGTIGENKIIEQNPDTGAYFLSGGGGIGIIEAHSVVLSDNITIYTNTIEKETGASEDQTVKGTGILVGPSNVLTIKSNTANFTKTNEIYLSSGATVDIGEGNSFNSFYIVPSEYVSGTVVVSGDTDNYAKCKIIDNDETDPYKWFLTNTGALVSRMGDKAAPDKVGDVVFSDGSASYVGSLNSFYSFKGPVRYMIAIIFYVGTECSDDGSNRVLGVSTLRRFDSSEFNSPRNWCGDDTAGRQGKTLNITTIASNKNGSGNLQKARDFVAYLNPNYNSVSDWGVMSGAYSSGSNSSFPAKGTDFQTGWYLPTVTELLKVRDCSCKSLLAYESGAKLKWDYSSETTSQTNYYWTSTQGTDGTKAFAINMKTSENPVERLKYSEASDKQRCNYLAIRQFN